MHTSGFRPHDHAACVSRALAAAEARCTANNLHLTPARRRVLEILLTRHRALGAYDILARLASEGLSAQPPTAYRALDFLVANGFAHKIERLNAYIACARPGTVHSPAFLICRRCDTVAETTGPDGMIDPAARAADFLVETTVIEAEGLCPDCRSRGE